VIDSTYQKQNRESLHALRAQKKHPVRRWTWILVPDREEPPKQRGTWRAGALWVDSGLGRDPSGARPSWNLQHTGPPTLWCVDKGRCSEQQIVRTHLHQHQSEVLIQDDSKGFVTHKYKDSTSNSLSYDRRQHLHPEHTLFSCTSFFLHWKYLSRLNSLNRDLHISFGMVNKLLTARLRDPDSILGSGKSFPSPCHPHRLSDLATSYLRFQGAINLLTCVWRWYVILVIAIDNSLKMA